MKKSLCCFIVLLFIVFLAACNAEKARETAVTAEDNSDADISFATDPTPDNAHHVSFPYHATVEYGEPDLITDNTGPLWVYVRFPFVGGAADEIITG